MEKITVIKTKEDWRKHKATIIKELAKLEKMKWNRDKDIAGQIFPYILIEAINILINSEIINKPFDHCTNSDNTIKMLNNINKI